MRLRTKIGELLWDVVSQSSEQVPFTSEIVGSILAADSCGKSQRCTECRKFSPGTPVSSHREFEFWQGDRSCALWSDMNHKVAVRGALTMPLKPVFHSRISPPLAPKNFSTEKVHLLFFRAINERSNRSWKL
jgi:hypothetical protein